MKPSLGNTAIWTATATLVKSLITLLVMKLIALHFGAEGIGRAANYMTLLTILGVFAGAGIFNGVTKYVAEYENDPEKRLAVVSTAFLIVILFSFCLAIVGTVFSAAVANFIFSDPQYQSVIRLLAWLQFAIALGNYCLAVLKGLRDAKGIALANIIGLVVGLALFIPALYVYQYQGTLIGLALMPALIMLPAYYFLRQKCGRNFACFEKSYWRREYAGKLSRFGLMTFVTVITVPVAYMLLRNRLEALQGIEAVGLWQGVTKISDVYLQFITGAFSVYLLPTFAKLTEKRLINSEVKKALKLVIPLTLLSGLLIYVARSFIIEWLFSSTFSAMSELFIWQLIGDLFKVSAYIFGYLLIAKAALRIYIVGELLQFVLLLGLGSSFIAANGAIGAVQAYMLTYILYFLLCILVFFFYRRETI